MQKTLYDIKWEQKLAALSLFRKANQDRWPLENSNKFTERSLGKWCRDQRTAWKQGRLPASRQKALGKIGFPFYERTREGKWMKQYNKIKLFYKTHRHYPADAGALSWLSQQELRYDQLSPAQRSLLKAISFKQELKRNLRRENAQQHWTAQLQKVQQFYRKHKRLPSRKDDPVLHSWLYNLRAAVKNDTLSGVRKKLLGQTGIAIMTHTFNKKSWDERMSELIAFQKKAGMPSLRKKEQTYEPSLYQWLSIQHAKHSRNELSATQIRQLKTAKVL